MTGGKKNTGNPESERLRDLGNLLALIEYAKAETRRLKVPTAPFLLAAAMEAIEEDFMNAQELVAEPIVGDVIRLCDVTGRRPKGRKFPF